MNRGSTSPTHDKLLVAMLKADPLFIDVYLAEALDQSDQSGGQHALLLALRHIAEAKGLTSVAQKAGIRRESLYRALRARGNPTLKTLLAVMSAVGLQLSVTRRSATTHAN